MSTDRVNSQISFLFFFRILLLSFIKNCLYLYFYRFTDFFSIYGSFKSVLMEELRERNGINKKTNSLTKKEKYRFIFNLILLIDKRTYLKNLP